MEIYDGLMSGQCFGTMPRNFKTIFGWSKWFDPNPENRVKLMLDCDEHTLEFRLLKEEESFWKIALPEHTKNRLHYPFVGLFIYDCSHVSDVTATFSLDD